MKDILLSSVDNGEIVFDILVEGFWKNQKRAVVQSIKSKSFPEPWCSDVVSIAINEGEPAISIKIQGSWRFYRAKLEAYYVNGTYIFTEDNFYGTFATPAIDVESSEPGPGWERISNPPKKIEQGIGLVFAQGGDIKQPLLENICDSRIGDCFNK